MKVRDETGKVITQLFGNLADGAVFMIIETKILCMKIKSRTDVEDGDDMEIKNQTLHIDKDFNRGVYVNICTGNIQYIDSDIGVIKIDGEFVY